MKLGWMPGAQRVILVVVLAMMVAAPVAAVESQPPGDRTYRVSGIRIVPVHDLPEVIQLARRVEMRPLELARLNGVYSAPWEDLPVELIELDPTPRAPITLDRSALEAIASQVAELFEEESGVDGFYVAVDPLDVDPETGRDLRPAARTTLRLRVEYTDVAPYLITEIVPTYVHDVLPGIPTVDELMRVPIELVRVERPPVPSVWTAWRPATEGVRHVLTLNDIRDRETERYTAAGIQEILEALRDHLIDRGLMGVIVQPSEDDLDRAKIEPTALRLVLVTGVVGSVRTLAAGERFPDDVGRVDHPAHRRIRERSPLQRGDILRRDVLDEYVYHIGRHPGRRMDVALAPSDEMVGDQSAVNVDYLITENRPWLVYAQGSNTGTPHTGRWRQRFGLFHSQFLGFDDILNIDYNTAGFSDSHIVSGSYEFPLIDPNGRLRARLHGLWNKFDASEVGVFGFTFTGESWGGGGELIANVIQDGQLFVDLVGGARYLDVRVRNLFFGFPFADGHEDFFLPYGGVRFDRITETAATRGSVIAEINLPDVTGADIDQMNQLGRLFPDRQWVTLQWDLTHSMYLEPLLNPGGWQDPATPGSTLAHEIALSARGQYAFGNRLVPQFTKVLGGFHTVRGYPESIASGDDAYFGSVEYRFHLPRIFAPDPDPQPLWPQLLGRDGREPFRWAPQHVYGRPDWDLIFRGFFDIGRTLHNDRQAFEQNRTLMGAGVGVEFQFMRHLNLRLDWGFALRGIEGQVSSGSNRLHFMGTFVF